MHQDSNSQSGTITLVLGGVRSGKSRFAQDLAAKVGGDQVLFVATAETRDDEMLQRVEHHDNHDRRPGGLSNGRWERGWRLQNSRRYLASYWLTA